MTPGFKFAIIMLLYYNINAMKKTIHQYPKEIRKKGVEEYLKTRSINKAALKVGCSTQAIWDWVRKEKGKKFFKIPRNSEKIKLLTEVEKAYIAGIFDGEGCIGLSQRRDYKAGYLPYWISIQVVNTDFSILEYLKEKLGCGIHLNGKENKEKNHKERRAWTSTTYKADIILKAVQPYIRIKKKQVELAIKFHKERHIGIEHQKEMYEQMKAYNKKGLQCD